MTGFIRHVYRNERGSVLIEFAFAVPLMLILIAGFAEIGRAFYHHHVLSKAVRDATRYLTRVPDPTAADDQAIATNLVLRGAADNSAPLLLPSPNGTPAVVVTFPTATIDNSADPPPWYGPPTITVIQTRAAYTFQSPLLGNFGVPATITMTVAHTERHIGE